MSINGMLNSFSIEVIYYVYQGTILGIRFYYKRFYKERRGCKNPSTEIQYWWMSHALVTPRD